MPVGEPALGGPRNYRHRAADGVLYRHERGLPPCTELPQDDLSFGVLRRRRTGGEYGSPSPARGSIERLRLGQIGRPWACLTRGKGGLLGDVHYVTSLCNNWTTRCDGEVGTGLWPAFLYHIILGGCCSADALVQRFGAGHETLAASPTMRHTAAPPHALSRFGPSHPAFRRCPSPPLRTASGGPLPSKLSLAGVKQGNG
jgi:hypothetical protein